MSEIVNRHLAQVLPDLTGLTLTPASETAQAAIAELRDDFDLLEDWTARYQYLIDLGRGSPPLPEAWRTPAHLLHGCQSQVWFVIVPQDGRLHLLATSDSTIVAGLIALLQRVYSGRSAQEILTTGTGFLADLGLDAHLSPTRRNGLAAMIGALREIAQSRLQEAA